jgi:hypothetical protein
MPRTKVDAEMEAAVEAHADDPERAELLQRARRFKNSWLELAEALTEARRSRAWERWGFESFEAYTRSELHLRPETAEKLTASFAFLRKRAPRVLERDGVTEPIPSYQAVDFLRRAAEEAEAPHDVVDEIRARVLDEGASAAKVSREFGGKVFPIDKETQQKRDAAGVRNVATRLRELLGETRAVPRRVAHEAIAALDTLLEALEKDEDSRAA